MVSIIQIDPTNHRQRRAFLDLPFRLYRDIPHWVPPLRIDASRQLDPHHNGFFKHGDAAFLLAVDDHGEALARLAVLDNRAYNQFNASQTAFFYLFECVNDAQVASSIFERAFDWAAARGLDCISGPKGFTVMDGMGLLVKGFEHRPAFGLPYNPPYYANLIEDSGFSLEGEMVSGYLNREYQMPEKVRQVARLVAQRKGIRAEALRSRKQLAAVIPELRQLYNLAIEGTSGNVPLTDEDIRGMASQLLWFADPRLIKVLRNKDDQAIGFLLAYPDVSAALQRCRGRLLPFGWLDLLIERRRTQWININGAGISSEYRGMGGTAVLFDEMYKSVIESRYLHADLVQIGTENDRMQRELRSLGIDFYKTHRLYQRKL